MSHKGGIAIKYSFAEYVPIFKALADETRLRIVELLVGGELCACKLLEYVSITQPTLSYHMKILMECGLVDGVRDGAWMRYTLSRDRIILVSTFWSRFAGDHCDCLCKAWKAQ